MVRIACIEEDDNLLSMLDIILIEAGFETALWPGADGAQPFLRRERPDVLLLEMRLAGEYAGLRILEGVRNDPETADIPVIVCSGDVRFLKSHDRALRTLAAAVLEKPFTAEQLLTTVRRVVDPSRFRARINRPRGRDCAIR